MHLGRGGILQQGRCVPTLFQPKSTCDGETGALSASYPALKAPKTGHLQISAKLGICKVSERHGMGLSPAIALKESPAGKPHIATSAASIALQSLCTALTAKGAPSQQHLQTVSGLLHSSGRCGRGFFSCCSGQSGPTQA